MSDRFWMKVRVGTADQCWPWLGATTGKNGYGQMGVGETRVLAHRLALQGKLGRALRQGMWALHRCDNRCCVNPAHLYEGTPRDNARDRDNKGRGVLPNNRGERHGLAKLKQRDVNRIRKLFEKGITQTQLASMFDVTRSQISHIVTRKAWK